MTGTDVALVLVVVVGLGWFALIGTVLLRPGPAERRARALEASAQAALLRAQHTARQPRPTALPAAPALPLEVAHLTGLPGADLARWCTAVELRTSQDGQLIYLACTFAPPCPVVRLIAARHRGELQVQQVRRSALARCVGDD